MSGPHLNELVFEAAWRRSFPDWDISGESRTAQAERLLEAFDYFTSNFWHIRHPTRGRIKLDLRPAQIETVRVWIRERDSLALKARQIGFSTLAGAFAFWATYGYSDRAIIMLSRTERDAAKLLDKAKYGYKFLPDWMKIHARAPIVDSNLSKMSMTNESYIESLPSASDPARGESVWMVFVDEIGFLPNDEEAWASIEPIADNGGRIAMLGTANGEGNLLHREWVKSRGKWGNGTGRFYGIFFNWASNTDRDQAWYEAKKRDLPDWQLAQEYPDNPEEAFLRSGRPVFDLETLRDIETEDPVRGHLRRVRGTVVFLEDGGPLRVWEPPVEGDRYSMGVDVAEGLEHGDYSSVHVISAKTGLIVAHWHGHVEPDLLGSDIVPMLGQWYNQALAIVESNNHGLTAITALQRVKYHPIYRRRRLASRAKQATEVMGWSTTVVTKPLAIDELAGALRVGRDGVSALDLRCSETLAELRTFVRDAGGKTHGSPHDDRVMSLAIANQGLKYVHLREYTPKKEPPHGTFGWWMNQPIWGDDEAAGSEPPIGAHAVA